jgi:signal transduction histidine kinase
MNRVKYIIKKIIGENANFTTEERLLISIVLVSFLMSVYSAICNYLLNLNPLTIIFSLACAILFLILYWFSRVKRWYFFTKILTVIILVLILNLLWITNSGSYGPVPLVFVMFFTLFVFLWNGWRRIAFIAFFIINLIFQYVIETKYNHLIISYKDNNIRFDDFYAGFFIVIGISLSLIIYIKRLLNEEKEKVIKADKLKSAFLANISHEIRTPMNGIIGFAKLLEKKDLPEEKRLKYAQTITECSNNLLNIVNEILDISKIETGQIVINNSLFNVRNLIIKVIHLYKNSIDSKNLKINLESNVPNTFEIYNDEQKFFQIISNLINNAIKYTLKGHIKIEYKVVNNFIKFCIEDTGIGIAKEHQEEIFERFKQVKNVGINQAGGAGLGLAISKGFVEILGGKIWVDSEMGKGSKFYFSIPLKTNLDNNNV